MNGHTTQVHSEFLELSPQSTARKLLPMKLWDTWWPPVWIWVSMWVTLKRWSWETSQQRDVVPEFTGSVLWNAKTRGSCFIGQIVGEKMTHLLWRENSWEGGLGSAAGKFRMKVQGKGWKALEVNMLLGIGVPVLFLWPLRTVSTVGCMCCAGISRNNSHCWRKHSVGKKTNKG